MDYTGQEPAPPAQGATCLHCGGSPDHKLLFLGRYDKPETHQWVCYVDSDSIEGVEITRKYLASLDAK